VDAQVKRPPSTFVSLASSGLRGLVLLATPLPTSYPSQTIVVRHSLFMSRVLRRKSESAQTRRRRVRDATHVAMRALSSTHVLNVCPPFDFAALATTKAWSPT